jgi:putative cell wall-binding protein
MVADYVAKNLVPGGTVYILGGTSAVAGEMDTLLADFQVERLAGANRFETNLMILEEAGVAPGEEILVCTATNFADSLSASATGKPILLVYNEKAKLTDSQITYLESLEDNAFCVIGGENAVGEKLYDAVAKYGSIHRLAGANRFDTSVQVAVRYFKNPSSAVLAYARNYPDGLCGGPLAYAMGAPLILTMTKYESDAKGYIAKENILRGSVLGGTGLISNKSIRSIFAMEPDSTVYAK